MSDTPPISAVWRGAPYPPGATWDGEGVNFALFSEHSEKVELCLFDAAGQRQQQVIEIRERTDNVWHCYLPEARPGLLYGCRVHGPYKPEEGHRFNPAKLLTDPYAREIVGEVHWDDALHGYAVGHENADLERDGRDSAPFMPKCRVVDSAFTWGDDRRPGIPWHDMVIYELHTRGFTRQHPEVPPAQRGTYAGLASAPAIEYLKRLGVTTVELMPVHAFIDDRQLVERKLRNYWGYNTLGFFAPEPRYSATGSSKEFKTMVKRLHSAGIEVLIDVVYNHTCEGNHLGPTLSFRGVDNASYYRLVEDDRRHYMDFTGCGNTLNLEHPRVLQMVMDSLRYWVEEMHVDGFRFDLAPALAREGRGVEPLSGFFTVVRQDPVLNRVKLIAEPWDVGEGGYQVGNFPLGWAEWNDRYRNGMRAYWKGDGGVIGEFARRLTGSSDLYGRGGRRPFASINFVTAHDGFTLHDVVSYNEKHNEANGEGNRDGHNENLSWNCGAEGATDDPAIGALRERQKRNFLATLLLSQGVPMLLAGDERGHSQNGNNNAYCQDNETSWIDWRATPQRAALTEFTRLLISLRRSHRIFRRRDFFEGRPLHGTEAKDIHWLHPDGSEMTDDEWDKEHARSLGVYLAGGDLAELDRFGMPATDDDFLILFNAHSEAVEFRLPALGDGPWHALFDTAVELLETSVERFTPEKPYRLEARSLALLTRTAAQSA
ncbi:MAG: glycogen debranching protein GlgX [Betaproteobacteria bacterium]|nr:glycogen debranching protein GlgX [Betaproteobacteria bacterium]